MPRYMLDTNVISDVVHDPRGAVARRLSRLPSQDICTSVIAAGELRYGAERRGSARLSASVAEVLGALAIAPLEPPVDETLGHLRSDLEARGVAMGANDLWIAAHALTLDCVLVTRDKAFERVEGLKVETWGAEAQ